MRIALCLSGYFNGRRFKSTGTEGFKYLYNILKGTNADVFLHSWDVKHEKEIISLYNPLYYIFEDQRNFKEVIRLNSLGNGVNIDWLSDAMSYAYGRSNSIKLKMEYARMNNIYYDWTIMTRFDLGIHAEIAKLTFDSTLDNNFVYLKWWDQLNNGVPEQWLYSNSENMNLFSNLYNNYLEYFKDSSNYYKTLGSWPQWNSFKIYDKNNMESCLENTIEKYGIVLHEHAANNHVLYKYFIIEQNISDKLRFLK